MTTSSNGEKENGMEEQVRNPQYKRSKKTAPFCPTCDIELDTLSLINNSDTCRCGEWWDGDAKTYFKPFPSQKPYNLVVNGVEQNG